MNEARAIRADEWEPPASDGSERGKLNLVHLVTRGRGRFNLSRRGNLAVVEFDDGSVELYVIGVPGASAESSIELYNFNFFQRWQGQNEILIEVTDEELLALRGLAQKASG